MSERLVYRKNVHRLWPHDADSSLSDLLEVNKRSAERWRTAEKPAPAAIEDWVSKSCKVLDEIAPDDPEAGALMGRMIQILWRIGPAQADLAPRLLQAVLENKLNLGPEESSGAEPRS